MERTNLPTCAAFPHHKMHQVSHVQQAMFSPPNALITVMQASMFSHFTIRHSQHMCHAAEPEHDEHKNTCHFFIFGLLFWGSHCFICAPIPSCFVNCFLCFQKGWLNKGLQTHTFNATVQCTHVHEMSIIQQSS